MNDKKKMLFTNLNENDLNKYIRYILIFALFAPFIVCFLFATLHFESLTKITADGLLAYLGVVIASFLSALGIAAAFYQMRKQHEYDCIQDIEQRKREIAPHLLLKIENEDEYLVCSITNLNKYPAMDLYLFQYRFCDVILGNATERIKLVFSCHKNDVPDAIRIEDAAVNFSLKENEFPPEIDLIFGDIDDNTILQTFKLSKEDNKLTYYSTSIEYC